MLNFYPLLFSVNHPISSISCRFQPGRCVIESHYGDEFLFPFLPFLLVGSIKMINQKRSDQRKSNIDSDKTDP
jgi:hypothetical protein